jgi:hypothetical protein
MKLDGSSTRASSDNPVRNFMAAEERQIFDQAITVHYD